MNSTEAKQILLCYRPGTGDADDPQIAEALALAKRDAELAHWLSQATAQQALVRAKFRRIEPPAGLREQIISEHAAAGRRIIGRARVLLGATVTLLALIAWVWLGHSPRAEDNTLAIYQNRMAGEALRGYNMDLTSHDESRIRTYLGQHAAPADYVLPPALQKTAVAGCAVEGWQGTKVAMVCFQTGRPLAPGEQSDMWLFVVDRAAVAGGPADNTPRFTKVNRLNTAMWTQGGKLYLLGVAGDEAQLRKFL